MDPAINRASALLGAAERAMGRFQEAKYEYTHRPPPSIRIMREARISRFGHARRKAWRALTRHKGNNSERRTANPEMWSTLGETLTWICALDEVLRLRDKTYEKRRNDTPGGHVIPGLRFIRNHVLHGETIFILSKRPTLSSAMQHWSEMFMPRFLSGALRADGTLYYHMTWIDADLLPRSGRSQFQEKIYRDYLSNGLVVLSISVALDFLRKEIANANSAQPEN
jgi:hypothetical protein